MKTKLITTLAALAFLPLAIAQTPPTPPNPPNPPQPPQPAQPAPPRDRDEKLPKVPVTFMGVETSEVPRVVCEQLGLQKGFGLVVDYIVPNGPAATAGLQQNDILKMYNDQILVDPSQLSKLIRSASEGTTVTLTVLRKGQEQKVSVKLGKKEVPQRRDWNMRHGPGDMDFGDLGDRMDDLMDQMGDKKGLIHDAVIKAHEAADQAREEARERAQEIAEQAKERAREGVERAREQAREQAQRARDYAQRMRDQAQQQRDLAQQQRELAQAMREKERNGQITITKNDGNVMKTTHIDLRKAQIVFSDDKGELRIDGNSGKKVLTAKDPQGRLLFSGPVETKEELDKVPAEIRQRFDQLQQKDLPSIVSENGMVQEENSDAEVDSADEDDNEDEDSDSDAMSSVEQVSTQVFPVSFWTYQTVLI